MINHQFKKFGFQPFLNKAIEELGFYQPTEIQEKMIPLILKGESAVGQSQTGTGKTHSYLLPILEKIDPEKQEVQAVITAPTRELASQIHQEIVSITKFSEKTITARCLIGGTDKQKDMEKLKNSRILWLVHLEGFVI